MTTRYNPQSIEKQVRKWPVLLSEKDLHEDLIVRLEQLEIGSTTQWLTPYSVDLPFDEDIIAEYGIDVCRFATINASYKEGAEPLLEPSFKWLANLDHCLSKEGRGVNPVPWLEALIQAPDHIRERKCDRLALALVMKAFKEATPHASLTKMEKALVFSCLFPFVPVYSAVKILAPTEMPTKSEIIDSFNDYLCVKVALEKGGWHWQVFLRKRYEENPVEELKNNKWIRKATAGQSFTLKEVDEGVRICFA